MSTEVVQRIEQFVTYAGRLRGDEKGEAQVFVDRFFQAFGHDGYMQAGAVLENRVRGKGSAVRFADLVWDQRLLLEMKSRGENLARHYAQVRDYWFNLFPKPQYVVLCNFDEFWIYDFGVQHDPVDKVRLVDLPERYTAFNFMFPVPKTPLFGNDRVAVTRVAADKVARVFNSLVQNGEPRERAQRFVLQCVIAMFSEDADLLPRGLFTELLHDCLYRDASAYDTLGGLFRQMDRREPARGGRYQKVPYFNGGVFQTVEPVELRMSEVHYLHDAAQENWSKVQPAIFGTLFQSSMDAEERHALGAHFTSEADIQKVVQPTIVRPWRERIEGADTLEKLAALRGELVRFRVLDPACGSGNFLYVAFREIKRLELELLGKVQANFKTGRSRYGIDFTSLVSTRQMFGIDRDSFAVELAKVTVMLAKELAIKEVREMVETEQMDAFQYDQPLPLDNLDQNIRCEDALFADWPEAEAIIGNPPFQSKNKMQQEFGPAYVNRVRQRYPEVPGRADYCVYWFRRAHDELEQGQRAGLVGTNTIRQNYSREGGLDYIVHNNGTITEAVSSQVWSGDAVVHVSIVNWIKGEQEGTKRLFTQVGDQRDSPVEVVEQETISSALSAVRDLTGAQRLNANVLSSTCYQGQTHGHEGFLLTPEEARQMVAASTRNAEVIFPYLTANEMLSTSPPLPQRYVIDFHPRDVVASSSYKEPFERVKKLVLPVREQRAKEEEERNRELLQANSRARVNRHHANFLNSWWQLAYARADLVNELDFLPRYISCGRVTKRPVFEIIDSNIRPNDALVVFAVADDYSFGILQSEIHWAWFTARCSTLKGDPRYTSNTVFDSFPWPQHPDPKAVSAIAAAAVKLRAVRNRQMRETESSLRDLYRMLELPGKNPLQDVHAKLNAAVRSAYGMKSGEDVLSFLLALNLELAEKEGRGEAITGPGLPSYIEDPAPFITEDCIQMPTED